MAFFSTAFTVLFPLFGKIAIGYGLRKFKLISLEALREFNNVVFRILLPILLFSNIYQANFSEITSFRLLGYAVTIILVNFTFYMFLIPKIIKDNRQRGVLIQGICRSNFIFFGIPMATYLYGETSAGLASLLVGVVVPIINVMSVIALEYFRGKTPNFPKILKGIILNPIIIGGVSGMICNLTGIRFPSLIENLISEIAGMATPLALIILGGSVTFTSVKANRKQLLLGVLNRLLIVPAVGIFIAILIGFRDVELVLIMALLASPSAVSSYTMAEQMGGDAELAGQIVVFTTVFSLFTLFMWLTGLMALGYF